MCLDLYTKLLLVYDFRYVRGILKQASSKIYQELKAKGKQKGLINTEVTTQLGRIYETFYRIPNFLIKSLIATKSSIAKGNQIMR